MTDSTFKFSEMGIETAQPVYLVDFAAALEHWRFTTAPFDIFYHGHSYANEPGLEVGRREITDNQHRALLDITVDCGNALFQRIWSNAPDWPISVTLYKGHVDSTGDYQVFGQGVYGDGYFGGHEFVRRWTGWVIGYEQADNRRQKFKCSPYWSDVSMAGGALRSGTVCKVSLGSTLCGVDLSPYVVEGTILTVSGDTITAAVFATKADGYFEHEGVIVTATHTRMILSHIGQTVVMSHAIPELAVGEAFTATPGCDHIWCGDCKTRYNNELNFQGQPKRPTANIHRRGVL